MSENNKIGIFVYLPLMLTIVIDALGVGLVFPVFASIFSQSGGILPQGTSVTIANLLYGVTLAAFPIGMFMGAPVLGDLSDHIGRKKVLLLCLYAECVCMWLCALALYSDSIPLIIIFRFLTGLFAGSIGIAQAAVIDISPSEKKAVNLSLISIALGVGFAVGPVAGSFFATDSLFGNFGYSGPFVFAGTLALINGTLLLFSFTETSQIRKDDKIVIYKGFLLFISGFSSRRLKKLAVTLLLIQMSWAIYFQTSSLLMVEKYSYNISDLGWFISLIAAVYSFTLIVVIRILGKFFTIERILLFSCIILAVGFFIASCNLELCAWISVIPISAGAGLAYLSIITLFSNAVGKKSQGWVMGIAGSVVAAASCFGSITAGVFTAISFPLTYILGALLPIITLIMLNGSILFLPLFKRKPKH